MLPKHLSSASIFVDLDAPSNASALHTGNNQVVSDTAPHVELSTHGVQAVLRPQEVPHPFYWSKRFNNLQQYPVHPRKRRIAPHEILRCRSPYVSPHRRLVINDSRDIRCATYYAPLPPLRHRARTRLWPRWSCIPRLEGSHYLQNSHTSVRRMTEKPVFS